MSQCWRSFDVGWLQACSAAINYRVNPKLHIQCGAPEYVSLCIFNWCSSRLSSSSVLFVFYLAFSALTLLVEWQEGHPACKKLEWWGTGVVICLERCADLHTAHLMPLPLTVSCFIKIQIGFTFLVPAHLGSPGQRAVKRLCVCVCVFIFITLTICSVTSWLLQLIVTVLCLLWVFVTSRDKLVELRQKRCLA